MAASVSPQTSIRALPEDLCARTLLYLDSEEISVLEKHHRPLIDRASRQLKADFRKEMQAMMQFAQSALTIPASAIAEVEKLNDQLEAVFGSERFAQIHHLQIEILNFLHLDDTYRLAKEKPLHLEKYEDRIDTFLALLFEWKESILDFLNSPSLEKLRLDNHSLYETIEKFCNAALNTSLCVKMSIDFALRRIDCTSPTAFLRLRNCIDNLKAAVSFLNFKNISSEMRSLKETILATVDPEPLRVQIPIFSAEVKKLAKEMDCIDRKTREIYLRFCGLQLCCPPGFLQGPPLHDIHPSDLDIKEVALYTAAYDFDQALYFARKTSGAIQDVEAAAIQARLTRGDFPEAILLMEREDFENKQDAQRQIFDAALGARNFDVLRQLRQHPLFAIQETFLLGLKNAMKNCEEELARQLVACDLSLLPLFDSFKKMLRVKHCLSFLMLLPLGCIATIIGLTSRIFQLLTFYHFWRERDEPFYNWKARLVDAGKNALQILTMPIVAPITLLCIEAISFYGIFFPFPGEKLFSKVIKLLPYKKQAQLENAQAEEE